MKTDSDIAYLTERESDNRICLNIVTGFACIFTAAFVIITTVSFLNIQDLDAKDAALRLQIETLQQSLQAFRESRGPIIEGAEELVEEIVQAAVERKGDEIDDNKDELETDSTNIDGEEKRGRRQQIDIFSAILAAQRSVFEKLCVSHNTTCPQGPRGFNGTTGDPGQNGVDGSRGTNGTKGITGEVGGPGLRGDVGSKGLLGDSGTTGTAGLIGDTGAWGVPGLDGDSGAAGLKGMQGDPGLKGSIGDNGPLGDNGTLGINGTKGDVGEPGLKGFNGTQGNIGPKGPDAQSLTENCVCYKKPTFKTPNDETIVVGSSDQTTLPCVGEGNPMPNITITKMLQKHGRKRAVIKIGNVITIFKPDDKDYGRYLCTAKNAYGTATKVVTVNKPTSGR